MYKLRVLMCEKALSVEKLIFYSYYVHMCVYLKSYNEGKDKMKWYKISFMLMQGVLSCLYIYNMFVSVFIPLPLQLAVIGGFISH